MASTDHTFLLKSEHQRIKTTVNFTSVPYTDTITDFYLIRKINAVREQVIKGFFNVRYGIFQRDTHSEKYGVILSELRPNLMYLLGNDPELVVLGALSKTTDKEEEKEISYFPCSVTGTRINYFGVQLSLNSFIQANFEVATLVHQVVNDIILPSVPSFETKDGSRRESGKEGSPRKRGKQLTLLGGELAYYGTVLKDKFSSITALTSDLQLASDYLVNTGTHAVIYEKNTVPIFPNTGTMIANLSKKGLTYIGPKLPTYVQLIYIGCCDDAVETDGIELSDRYKIQGRYRIGEITVIDFRGYL
jgi:hypothetical protein